MRRATSGPTAFHDRSRRIFFEKASLARLSNRTNGTARGPIFLSGDIHVGCIFDISVLNPPCKASSITSSGISQQANEKLVVGSFVDESFQVAPGIHSTLRQIIDDFNFGVVEVVPAGDGATMLGAVVHQGTSLALGLDITVLL